MTADARVLVVDDEERVRKLLTRLLQEEGHRVRAASSGREALEALEGEAYDLVLTDLTMPGMSGMDLLSEIREKWPEMSVILITAFGTVESAVEAMHKGGNRYLTQTTTTCRSRPRLGGPCRGMLPSIRFQKMRSIRSFGFIDR